MKMSKDFNAVQMMREIRDKLSSKFVEMSYGEQKKYIKERIKTKRAFPIS